MPSQVFIGWTTHLLRKDFIQNLWISPDEDIEIGEATTREEIVNRNLTVISSAIMNGMGEIFDFTMDSFMRNEISSFLTLPIRLGNKIPFLDYLTT